MVADAVLLGGCASVRVCFFLARCARGWNACVSLFLARCEFFLGSLC